MCFSIFFLLDTLDRFVNATLPRNLELQLHPKQVKHLLRYVLHICQLCRQMFQPIPQILFFPAVFAE